MERTITAAESGQKILKFLLKSSDGTKIFLFKLFRKGDIKVNGKRVERDYELNSGDVVSSRQLLDSVKTGGFQNVRSDIAVLFEDAHVIAVDKDDNTLVHAAHGEAYQDTLLERVKAYLYKKGEDHTTVAAVHRIDRNTKGVVVFAKNNTAAKLMNEQFREGLVTKTYEALLWGKLEKSLFAEADIHRSQGENGVTVSGLVKSIVIPDKSDWLKQKYQDSATVSATVFRPVRFLEASGQTIASVAIWTGRHHQIRAVAQALGYPLVGDRMYPGAQMKQQQAGVGGQVLICKRIEMENPAYCFESRYQISL